MTLSSSKSMLKKVYVPTSTPLITLVGGLSVPKYTLKKSTKNITQTTYIHRVNQWFHRFFAIATSSCTYLDWKLDQGTQETHNWEPVLKVLHWLEIYSKKQLPSKIDISSNAKPSLRVVLESAAKRIRNLTEDFPARPWYVRGYHFCDCTSEDTSRKNPTWSFRCWKYLGFWNTRKNYDCWSSQRS